MLKRRASKRFVLAETGEESSWNTSDAVDPDLRQPSPPTIEFENDDSIESGESFVVEEDQPIVMKQHLALPETSQTPGIK